MPNISLFSTKLKDKVLLIGYNRQGQSVYTAFVSTHKYYDGEQSLGRWFPVVVFQGTADNQTPIEALRTASVLPQNSQLIAVPSGTHSNTYLLALEPYVQAVIQMLQHENLF